MVLFHVRRNHWFWVTAAAGAVAAHMVLCWPAAVARGYPAIHPWHLDACYVAPFGMIIPPLFDDGRNRPKCRMMRILLVAMAFAFIWAVVEANKGMTPSIGSLAGVGGILQYRTGEVFFSSVLFTLVAFPVFLALDRVAAGCWGLVRQFSDDEGKTVDSLPGHARLNFTFGRTMENTNYSWKKVGYALLIMALVLPWLVANRFSSYRLHERESLVRSNLKLIQIALQEYYVEQKSLPFSPEGPDHALYKLKPYINAECFDGDTKKPQEARAFWDDEGKRLRNNDFFYLNEPSVKPDFARIVLMSRPGLTGESVYLATGMGIRGHEAKEGDLRLLGSCQTPDLFLIANFGLYQEWLKTHADSIAQSGSNMGMTSRGGNISIDYRYEGNRLRKCFITTDKGVIEETVELDDLGRIAKLSRKPDHWERLLGE